MKFLATLFTLLLLAPAAFSDSHPDEISLGPTGVIYKVCDAYAGTSVCTGAGGDQNVFYGLGFSSLTFYSMQSTSGYVCDIYSGDRGHDTSSADGFKVNSTSLSENQEAITLTGPFGYIWINCPTNGGGSVTINVFAKRN